MTSGVGGIKAPATDAAVWGEVDVHWISCRVQRTRRFPTTHAGQHGGQTGLAWEHRHTQRRELQSTVACYVWLHSGLVTSLQKRLSRLTISDDKTVKVASGVVLHVQRQDVKLHCWVWRADQPGTFLVMRVVLRPTRRKEEARGLPRH